MGKGIGRIYKQIHHNWPYPCSNLNFVLPQCTDLYIQTQLASSCDASVGAQALEYAVSDQIISHNVNTDVNDNDDSQSFERHRYIIVVLPLLVIQ